MSNKYGIPLKQYRLLTGLLNQDKEIYTKYESDQMPHRVIFDDLVRTLEINPDLYHRPIVELEDYGYMVKGNNIFFEAGLKAGLKSFICDVNIRTFDDKHTSQFLAMEVVPGKAEYQLHKIFFVEPVLAKGKKDEIIKQLNQQLKEKGFNDNVFFISNEYDDIIELKVRHTIKVDNLQSIIIMAKEIDESNFYIRSANGLTTKSF